MVLKSTSRPSLKGNTREVDLINGDRTRGDLWKVENVT